MANKAKRIVGDFYIGMPVCGHYRVVPAYRGIEHSSSRERYLKRVQSDFSGLLTGGRYANCGRMTYYGHYEGWSFKVTKRVFVFLVRDSFLGKEIMVLPDDLKKDNKKEKTDFPLTRQSWSDKTRKELAEIMSKWPRDKKGRWIKTTVIKALFE